MAATRGPWGRATVSRKEENTPRRNGRGPKVVLFPSIYRSKLASPPCCKRPKRGKDRGGGILPVRFRQAVPEKVSLAATDVLLTQCEEEKGKDGTKRLCT